MKKETEHYDPLMQLQQTWQQHKEHSRGLPFLTDEELGDIFTRSQQAPYEPLPQFVADAAHRTECYARVRPFRYAVAICLAILLSGSAFAHTPSSTVLTRSNTVTVSSQEVADSVTYMLTHTGFAA